MELGICYDYTPHEPDAVVREQLFMTFIYFKL